mmetsp:Transcript_142610/g.397350  ORF Transcript_142610/g.397350 Transcript_142610/m.397350 type:complete len:201 (+) Transcript_142610:1187-1789(+)
MQLALIPKLRKVPQSLVLGVALVDVRPCREEGDVPQLPTTRQVLQVAPKSEGLVQMPQESGSTGVDGHLLQPVVDACGEVAARADEGVVHVAENLPQRATLVFGALELAFAEPRLAAEVVQDLHAHAWRQNISEDEPVQGLVRALRITEILEEHQVTAEGLQHDILQRTLGRRARQPDALQAIDDNGPRTEVQVRQAHMA